MELSLYPESYLYALLSVWYPPSHQKKYHETVLHKLDFLALSGEKPPSKIYGRCFCGFRAECCMFAESNNDDMIALV